MTARALLVRPHRFLARRREQLTVGIVANEFFDRALGRMGGFGWAARQSAECIANTAELRWRPVLLAGRGGVADHKTARRSNGVALVRYSDDAERYARSLARAGVSLYLTIDHRPNYVPVLDGCPQAPVLVWIRDPRPPADIEKIATLELPAGEEPAGTASIDCRSLGSFVERAREGARQVVFASPAPALAEEKASATYGTPDGPLELLPNPLDIVGSEESRAPRPRVVFLGRLDPIKRPWVFVELARRLPHVEFLMLGKSHFTGTGSWTRNGLPENLRALGHVDGEEKTRLLGSSWLLVNTSIHEALPISYLEALHCGVPIVGCQDPEQVASRFGVYVGRFDGSGLDGLAAFANGIEQLVGDHDLRTRLGHEGREWARATHTRQAFLAAFARLAGRVAAAGD